MKKQWIYFVLTRLVGLAADTVLTGMAYLAAVILRFDFCEPQWGWSATALSFVTVWLVQILALIVTGCYRLPWRRTGTLDLPRYVCAFALSAGVLAFLRWQMPMISLAYVRPPYSITLISSVLALCFTLGARIVWRFYVAARSDAKRLLKCDEQIAGSEAVLNLLRGKTVLVTGAGGTIGREIVRRVARNGAKQVIMVDRSENALYEIDHEMRGAGVNAVCLPEMTDIADEVRMRRVLAQRKPEIVLHAAGYKHVPMVEANPLDGLRNNAIAAHRLGVWCADAGVGRFMLVSTDKAVKPVSVMGMTKRLAEVLVLRLNDSVRQTKFSCVRFGNVSESAGSVVPLFREQIAAHKPVTVTHPEMRRYFMSVEESAALILEATAMGENCVYTLDMGRPVRILDLAEDMIRRAGYKPYVDLPVVFTGVRPGERLFEEIDLSEKCAGKTEHARIFVCKDAGRGDGVTADDVESFIAQTPGDESVRQFLRKNVGAAD